MVILRVHAKKGFLAFVSLTPIISRGAGIRTLDFCTLDADGQSSIAKA
jgi:hypothetical protein